MMQSIKRIILKSGHEAAVGVNLYMSYPGSERRPKPGEYEELIKKTRAELSKDEFWNNVLDLLIKEDAEERNVREQWKGQKKRPASGKSGA